MQSLNYDCFRCANLFDQPYITSQPPVDKQRSYKTPRKISQKILIQYLLRRVIESRSWDRYNLTRVWWGQSASWAELLANSNAEERILHWSRAKYKWQLSITQGFVPELNSGVVRINLSTVPGVALDRSLGKILYTEGEGRSKTLRKGGLVHCRGGSCLSRAF